MTAFRGGAQIMRTSPGANQFQMIGRDQTLMQSAPEKFVRRAPGPRASEGGAQESVASRTPAARANAALGLPVTTIAANPPRLALGPGLGGLEPKSKGAAAPRGRGAGAQALDAQKSVRGAELRDR